MFLYWTAELPKETIHKDILCPHHFVHFLQHFVFGCYDREPPVAQELTRSRRLLSLLFHKTGQIRLERFFPGCFDLSIAVVHPTFIDAACVVDKVGIVPASRKNSLDEQHTQQQRRNAPPSHCFVVVGFLRGWSANLSSSASQWSNTTAFAFVIVFVVVLLGWLLGVVFIFFSFVFIIIARRIFEWHHGR